LFICSAQIDDPCEYQMPVTSEICRCCWEARCSDRLKTPYVVTSLLPAEDFEDSVRRTSALLGLTGRHVLPSRIPQVLVLCFACTEQTPETYLVLWRDDRTIVYPFWKENLTMGLFRVCDISW
jgi:hypothetical protein